MRDFVWIASLLGLLFTLACRTVTLPLPTGDGLTQAARMGFVDDVRALLDRGVDPNAANLDGLTPLLAARAAGFEEVAALLVSRGAQETDADVALKELLDSGLKRRLYAGTPGAAVLVVRRGEAVFEGAYGDARIGSTPVTLDTQFRIGSITKQFTAAAILLLQQDGILQVEDPLSKWLPDFPPGGDMTLHQLLTHTAGLSNYTSAPGFFDAVTSFTTPEELIASFADAPLESEPGSAFSYSNSGYVLLGAVVETASGLAYGDFLRQRIFVPLGMRDTGVHPHGVASEREATGYAWGPDGVTPSLDWDMSRAGAAGALFSTVRDLARWNEAVFGSERAVLTDASVAAALREEELPAQRPGGAPEGTGYGYGFLLTNLRGLRVASHTGGLHGFSSYLAWFPDAELTIAVLHNAEPSRYTAAQIASPVAPLLLWRLMEPRASMRLDPKPDRDAWDEYVGRYRIQSWVQSITRHGDRLYSQLTGQARYEIFPRLAAGGAREDEAPFFFRVVDAQLVFLRDEEGRVTGVRHEQDGGLFVAPKLEDLPLVEVAVDLLDDYVGEYDYNGATLTVTREGRQLFAQLAGQARYDLHPRSETEFFWAVVDAQITFVRAPGGEGGAHPGRVTHAIHRQGGRTFEAPRLD